MGERRDPAEKAWIAAQDLSALGHIEVSWGQDLTWCAAPPVLTMIAASGGRALLTGARTRALYELPASSEDWGTGELADAVNELGLWIDNWREDSGPTTVMVACESAADAERLASRLGITYTYSVAAQLSELFPSLRAYERLWAAGDLPRGFEAEAYRPPKLRWEATETTSEYGLYRCRTWQGHVHALNGPAGWRRVPREQAVYEVLQWEGRQVLRYDAAGRELQVPVGARLPGLQSRAATLSSGRLPRMIRVDGTPTLHYANVSPAVAERIAGSLSQVLD